MIWVCPHCAGSGRLSDGSVTIGPDGALSNYKPASVCWVCDGSGKVKLVPYQDPALSSVCCSEEEHQ